MDLPTYLWNKTNEHHQQARQHETLRSMISTIVVSVSAAALAFGFSTKGTHFTVICAGVLTMLLARTGFVITRLHYARNRFHVAAASVHEEALLQELSERGELRIDSAKPLRQKSEDEYCKKNSLLMSLPGGMPGTGGVARAWLNVFKVMALMGFLAVAAGTSMALGWLQH